MPRLRRLQPCWLTVALPGCHGCAVCSRAYAPSHESNYLDRSMDTGGALHRKRCKRYDVPGHAHCLTFSCFQRRPFFNGRLTPAWFLESLDAARHKESFDLWAYVIMPEHVHLLVFPAEGSEISRILRRIKKPMTDRVLAWVTRNSPSFLARMEERRPSGKTSHRFWQPGGGYDRNVLSAEEIHEKLRYIHANPVRRGLAAGPAEWAWSSFRAWEEGLDEPIAIDRESFPVLER